MNYNLLDYFSYLVLFLILGASGTFSLVLLYNFEEKDYDENMRKESLLSAASELEENRVNL